MPPRISTSLPVLHLYRHILREASYLPPAVRPNVSELIRTRFQNHRFDKHLVSGRVRRARNTLRTLRAANNGDRLSLQGLLSKAFGRSGARRRELLRQITPAPLVTDTEALETIIANKQQAPPAGPKTTSPRFFNRWDVDKLMQLLQSQRNHQRVSKNVPLWSSQIRALDPDVDIPKVNIWGRPPADSLCQTKREKWWKRTADKIMPPVSKGEWDLLGKLSRGAQREAEWALPARRAKATAVPTNSDEASPVTAWDWKPYASRPASTVEKPKARPQKLRSGQQDKGPYSPKNEPRVTTPRFYERMYRRIWATTPKMERDPKTLQYSFQWGPAFHDEPNTPTQLQLAVFEGTVPQSTKPTGKKRG